MKVLPMGSVYCRQCKTNLDEDDLEENDEDLVPKQQQQHPTIIRKVVLAPPVIKMKASNVVADEVDKLCQLFKNLSIS